MKRSHILAILSFPLLIAAHGCGTKAGKNTADAIVPDVEQITGIAISQPQKALAMIDSAQLSGKLSDFQVNRMRALVYKNGLSNERLALHYSLEAYNSSGTRENTDDYLYLLDQLADDCYNNADYSSSIRYCTEGLEIARDNNDRAVEADLLVTMGCNLYVIGRSEEASENFLKAIEILDLESKTSSDYAPTDDYIYALGMMLTLLYETGGDEKALGYISRYEEAVDRLAEKDDVPEGLADMRLASGYAIFADMLKKCGDGEEADRLYNKLLATDFVRQPEGEQMRIPYLITSGKYREALHFLQREKQWWVESADTVSHDYIESLLDRELEVYDSLGDKEASNSVLREIRMLEDTLRQRERQAHTLELAEIYKTNEQALQIELQKNSILLRNVMIIFAVILLTACALFLIRITRLNRAISRKNAAMVKTIDELLAFKSESFERQEEVLRLYGTDSDKNQEQSDPEDTDTAGISLTDTDRAIFIRMNHGIITGRMFLNPDLSKKDLIAKYKIPSRKFSAMFKEFAGCTFPQYIQNCRVEHAVRLMRKNPHWNIESVAKEVRMSNGAFYSHFKRRFGMSPAEFKAGEALNAKHQHFTGTQ